ncbi:hypothetical protein DWV00_25375 [Trinickia dinghuensis]|uniref:Uncharacterized protein n=1 Tax=Trinickia dinghuensis TaxID=2291023 RepID=A0A3D8JS90_9BURK|nr:hypothetical protein DWV00_25375 [Trinickia dinghuensis]
MFGALLGTAGAALAQAEQNADGRGKADTQTQRMAPEDRDAAAGTEADRLEGLRGDPEALLGAPAQPGDPYGAAFDSTRAREQALTGTERVPRGALADGRYGPQPADKPPAPLPGMPVDKAARKAKVDKADPGTQSPTESALSIYHGPGDVGKAVGQVYKMPW